VNILFPNPLRNPGVAILHRGNRLIDTIVYAQGMPQALLLTAASLVLVITAAAAAMVPARRAAAVDPIQALRAE
jgi:ABC-type lipoprotein release transport system permease subunit